MEASLAACTPGPHAMARCRVWKPVRLLLREQGPSTPVLWPPHHPGRSLPKFQLSRRAGHWPLRSGTPQAGPRFLAALHTRDSQTLEQEGRWFVVGAKAWRSPEQVQLRGAEAGGCGRLVLCVSCGGLWFSSLRKPSWACSWRDAHPAQVVITVEAGAPVAGLGGAR